MRPRRRRDGGQILVLFVLALVAMFAMASLLFDGGNALVRKRQLQDAGDAAALAAANVIQSGTTHGCSTTAGPPPGAPRAEVVSAAQAAVTAALPGFDTSKIVVTCPDGWTQNYAVQVDISGRSPGYFGGVIGFSGFAVSTTSQAVNGQVGGLKYSVVELDPSNLTWPTGRQGCPSVQVQGAITVTLDGSMQIDSACPAGSGGALDSRGNSATLTFNNGSVIGMVGGYVPGPLTITPTPLTGQLPVRDPLAGLPAVPVAALPVQSNAMLNLNGGSSVLSPGVYRGGIQMKNSAKAFLQPGIYVMDGGGFATGAQNAVYSVGTGVSSTTDATWGADCLATDCGVLIFNTGFTNSNQGNTEALAVGAGATLKLRAYLPTADPNRSLLPDASAYQNLLFWQDANPVPTSGLQQPIVQLNGGGTVDLSGTVYAPSAVVAMGGGSGGSGGAPIDLTLQFISWDLFIQGTSSFHFYYQSSAFAKPSDYGLIK